MKKNYLIIALAALVVCACSKSNSSQTPAKKETNEAKAEANAKARAKVLKIACVQLDSLQEHYTLYKNLKDELEKKEKSAAATIDSKGRKFAEKYQSLQQRAQAGQLTQEQYEKEVAALQKEQNDLETLQTRLTTQLQNESAEKIQALMNDMRAKIREYAEAKGYDYILAQNSDVSNVLYAADAYDITNELIVVLNADSEQK